MAKKASPRSRKPAKAGKRVAPKASSRKRAAAPKERRAPARAIRKSKPKFGRLHQVALKATDLDASVAFYRDLLGLALIARFDAPGLAFFDLDGTRLMLSAGSGEGSLYFTVTDLDAHAAELEAKGAVLAQKPALVHRDEAGQFGKAGEEEWMAFLRDPSGNLIGFATRR